MDKRWIYPEAVNPPEAFRAFVGGDPLVAETLYRRGIRSQAEAHAFLDADAYSPCSPEALPDSHTAWRLIQSALKRNHKILVWGDFDVDGQTATTLLVESLQELGGRVIYHIPVRGEESHGINRSVLESYLDQGFDLLLTCDTGISEHENILRVRQAGIPVIVTDHHSLGESLPPANAVVNPQRLAPDHPLRTLPGVGVAYKLIQGLYQHLGSPFNDAHYMELAALGIVADVAELHKDTRYLLQKGLSSLRQTRRIGLKTLYEHAELNPQHINEGHIGFQIGPRLNAVGRLADANPIVEFLTTQDPGRARILGMKIEALNSKRRFATRQVEKAAEARLAASTDDRHAPAIVLHHPEWPGGVVGIVASRLVERYHKPVILLTGENPIHGSARSVPGINITEAIASQASLLIGYGGHPMAAGLSMLPENFQEKQEGLEVVPQIRIDRELTLDQMTLELINEVERLAPFGPGNPPLNFLIRDLQLVSYTDLGAQGEHRQVIAADAQQNTQRFIWWNGGDSPLPEAQFDLICTLSQSDYKGQQQISAEWIDFRLTTQGQEELEGQTIQIVDHRLHQNPREMLNQLLQQIPDAQVWAEGPLPEGFPGKGRHQLSHCETLVVWTAPPSQTVLEEALRRSHPHQVVVFGIKPELNSTRVLMAHLAGLVKYALRHKHGETQLTHLASACGTGVGVIQVGLRLWEALGKLKFDVDGDRVIIGEHGEGKNESSIEIYQEILQSLMGEITAFRHYFCSASLTTFVNINKA